MIELKKCPFCGSDNIVLDHFEISSSQELGTFVVCNNCEASTYNVDIWNTRPIEDKLRAQLEEIKILLKHEEDKKLTIAELSKSTIERRTKRAEKAEAELVRLTQEKEYKEQQFIWWVWNVYARNVNDLIYAIMGATTYDTEGEAKEGKYGLPKHCFDLIKLVDEYTEHVYDGTILDVQCADAKKGASENKPAYNENANSLLRSAWMIANRNGEQTNWEAFKNAVYKELVEEQDAKNSKDNDKCSKWKAYIPGQSAPAVNQRYIVKLKNDWIVIATYYLRVGGGYWKNDSAQELNDGVVLFWKELEE